MELARDPLSGWRRKEAHASSGRSPEGSLAGTSLRHPGTQSGEADKHLASIPTAKARGAWLQGSLGHGEAIPLNERQNPGESGRRADG